MAQLDDFVYAFLDVVFSKIALPGQGHFAHRLCRESFGDRKQLHRSRIAPTRLACFANARLHLFELFNQRSHGMTVARSHRVPLSSALARGIK